MQEREEAMSLATHKESIRVGISGRMERIEFNG